MKDCNEVKLNIGDTLEQIIDDFLFPKGARYKVIEFGIEPSTCKKIVCLKSFEKDYLVVAYQCELKFFRKLFKN